MSDWASEKRARFVFFVGLGLLALITIDPQDFFGRLDYDIRWIYDDGWMHLLATALILMGAWKWIDARSI